MEQADEVHSHIGSVGPLELLFEDEFFHGGTTPPATFYRPVDSGIAGIEQQALPMGVIGATTRPVIR